MSLEGDSSQQGNKIYDKDGNIKKMDTLMNNVKKTVQSFRKKKELNTDFTCYVNIKSKWIKDLV